MVLNILRNGVTQHVDVKLTERPMDGVSGVSTTTTTTTTTGQTNTTTTATSSEDMTLVNKGVSLYNIGKYYEAILPTLARL